MCPRFRPQPPPAVAQILARRAGRIAFGAVLLAGAPLLVLAAWSNAYDPPGATQLGAMHVVGLIWLCAAIAGAAVRRIAARRRGSADPEALFAASLMVPAAGIALLLPISLHLPVVLLLAGPQAFDAWVGLSVMITGLTHIVFASLTVGRAHRLVAGKPALSPVRIYVTTVIASCVPFVVLVIPPALVAITGLPFLPMLSAMERLIARERAEFAAAAHELPRAIAVLQSRA